VEAVENDPVFVALTRPQMFAGVAYSYFVANAVLATEFFLVFHTAWVLLAALIVHFVGVLACLNEPRFFDLWLARVQRCPRVRNFTIWQCNSYRP
jgi:type IV secretion system protein VirB3